MSAFSAVVDCVANDGWVKTEFEVSYHQIHRGANCLIESVRHSRSIDRTFGSGAKNEFWICLPIETHDTQSLLVKASDSRPDHNGFEEFFASLTSHTPNSKRQAAKLQICCHSTIFGIRIAWVRGLVVRGCGNGEFCGVAMRNNIRFHPACFVLLVFFFAPHCMETPCMELKSFEHNGTRGLEKKRRALDQNTAREVRRHRSRVSTQKY